MTRGTLRGRLALVAVATTAAWVGLLTVAFNVLLASQLHAQAGNTLRERAEAAASSIELRSDGTLRVHEPAAEETLDTDVWIYQGITALERPRGGQRVQAEADRLAGRGERFEQTEEPSTTRLYALPLRQGGRQVGTVVTAVSLEPYSTIQRLALAATVGLAVLLLVGVYAATLVLVKRALSPVQVMAQQAARWSAADAVQRFGTGDRPGELAALAESLDGVLERQAALLRHEQQVTEELSHELRTPLSLITVETELLQARTRSAAERDRAASVIAAGAARMSEILETLLTTARSRSSASRGRCEVGPVLDRAVEVLDRTRIDVLVECHPAALLAGVDAAVLERILAPLVENSSRYAVQQVRLDAHEEGTAVIVLVADDGPGVPVDLREAVFEPGRRGSDDGHPGAGLGLALARRLAHAAGGGLVATGDGFEVRLPRG